MKETKNSSEDTPRARHMSDEAAKLSSDFVSAALEKLHAEQNRLLESAEKYSADSDWDRFRYLATHDGELFSDPRYRIENFSHRFDLALAALDKEWSQLMPIWARMLHRFNELATIIGAVIIGVGMMLAYFGDFGSAAAVGAVVMTIFIAIVKSGPDASSGMWVYAVNPKPLAISERWLGYCAVAGFLLVMSIVFA